MKYPFLLLLLFGGGLLLSAIHPHDYFTWFLEVLPALIGVGALAVTYRRFPLTPLTYWLILAHCYVLFIGGHYTYAEVPAFNWLRDALHQGRNNYDKVGHFMQGFVPALIAREVYLRRRVVARGGWLSFLVVCTCMAISAAYEFLEWGVALATGEGADAFLGTQGYAWDTQSDMLYATFGAIVAVVALAKVQDQQLRHLPSPTGSELSAENV